MRLKGMLRICLAACALGMLGGCAQNGAQVNTNPAPSSEYQGFYGPEQQYSGGDPNQALGEVNLNDIDMEQQGDVARLTLTFSLGSRYSGTDEAKMTSVPPYTAYCLGSPARFVLAVSGVEYWDYKTENDLQENPLIRGIIKQIPMDYQPFDDQSATTPMVLYLQLDSAAAYRVQENGDKLVIELRPVTKKTAATRYYVTANAFADFQEGKIDNSLGLAPVLCDDLTNTVLISRGFEKKEEAEAFMEQTARNLAPLLPDKKTGDILRVVKINGDSLPVYDKPDESALPLEPIVSIGGKPKILPVVMQGGMYLSTRPETGQLLFAKAASAPLQGNGQDEDTVYHLWLTGSQGEDPAKLTRTEFSFIADAQFSKDGSQLAVLETATASGKNTLYVYDMQSGVLRDLIEEGLDAEISDFEWGQDADTLYAIAANGGDRQLIGIRLDKAEPNEAFTVIGDPGNSAGSLAFIGNKLYYVFFPEYADAGTGQVIEVDLSNAARKQNFAQGTDFRISADGRYMAVIENNAGEDVYAEDPASRTGCTVSVLDMRTGERVAQAQTGFVTNFIWEADAQSLFLVTNAEDEAAQNGSQPSFAYVLSVFDVHSSTVTPLLHTSVSAIQASAKEDTLLLAKDSFSEYGKVFFETYALKLTGF